MTLGFDFFRGGIRCLSGTGPMLGARCHIAGSSHAAGMRRNCGCHSRKSDSSRSSSTAQRTCSSRWAPFDDQHIGWRFSHALIHQVAHSQFCGRAGYSQPMAVGMSVVCQAVLVVDEVFAQSQKMLAKSPDAINIHGPLGAYGSIDSLVYMAHSHRRRAPLPVPHLMPNSWQLCPYYRGHDRICFV
jgi:hypothetical protein